MKNIPTRTGIAIRLSAVLLLSGVLAGGLGCGSGNSGTGAITTKSVTGNWATPFSVPGSKTTLALTQLGTGVVGTGTYTIEAGRSGTISVTGTLAGSNFTATLIYDYGTTVTYTGTLPDANDITGTIHSSATGDYALNFVKQ